MFLQNDKIPFFAKHFLELPILDFLDFWTRVHAMNCEILKIQLIQSPSLFLIALTMKTYCKTILKHLVNTSLSCIQVN